MIFDLSVVSWDDDMWGDVDFIKSLKGQKTIEFESALGLVDFGKKCGCDIIVNAKDMEIRIYNDCWE